jgi:uncharacterized membrane protein YeaQ/YmgE (transglycosylase-associated protein family)
MGSLIGLLVMGLLMGAIAQSFAKKKRQEQLGPICLIGCVVAAFISNMLGLSWILAAVAGIGFMGYAQVQANK